jgi:hypothetical protein
VSGAQSSGVRRKETLALLREGGRREFATVVLLSAILVGLVFCFTRRLDATAPEFTLPVPIKPYCTCSFAALVFWINGPTAADAAPAIFTTSRREGFEFIVAQDAP